MRTEQNSPKAGYAFLAVTAALATLLRLATCSALASDKVDPPPPTADLPSSWLVLYNLDNPDSVHAPLVILAVGTFYVSYQVFRPMVAEASPAGMVTV